MQLTPEQTQIIQSSGNIRINAVAGSGKTTTILEYARSRPAGSRILYLAFNKTVKQEAAKKLMEKGIGNVTVETAHSLAYKHVVYRSDYRLKKEGAYKTNEIATLLNLDSYGQKHGNHIIANHIIKFISYFCNSNKQKVRELNYLDTIGDNKTKSFLKPYYSHIEKGTQTILAKMDRAEMEITHDFYLKKFQLSQPQLHYDFILFDEGQDASEAMLDVFLKQPATKVIVGDTHQQIYSWRFAINSLDKVDFKSYNLSNSFRFDGNIAKLANEVLAYKKLIGKESVIDVQGKGGTKNTLTKAVIARTNLGLLLKAIDIVTVERKLQRIYFEGNINSYTYADDGASLYDVLHLYNHRKSLIRDDLIRSMNSLEELEDYIDKTEDVQLGMMVEIVKEYGNEIPDIIKEIKSKHVENESRENAEMIFSTVHRCKGMEYDEVFLTDDFITTDRIEKITDTNEKLLEKTNEEINLLYVAITRTKNILHIPDKIMPPGFIASGNINVIKSFVEEEENEAPLVVKPALVKPGKNYIDKRLAQKLQTANPVKNFEGIRQQYKDAYQPWTDEQDKELIRRWENAETIAALASEFGRTKGAIRSRLIKLGAFE